MPNQSGLDAAVEAAMERRMQRDERTKEDWSPLDALRDDLQAALPHLQDQGLRELADWLGEKARDKEGAVTRCHSEAEWDLAPSLDAEAQAFRAVIKEIEERIDG